MGVHGLWQLLQSTGKTVPLDSLEGKVLAVDVSIWLHQAIKGMRDRDGNTLPNAHLQVLFNRICKLLYYRIKPVFVFDGGVPELKKQTLVSRRERKEFANQESERTSKKLLENLMRSRAVKEVLAGEAVKDEKPIKVNKNRAKDLYELPPLPKEFQSIAEETDYWEERKQTQQMIQEELENNADFDTTSEDFKSLPAELKHEILTEIQERTKRTPWTNLHELPEESDDFSSFQMKKLLKKGRLTHQLDHVRKEMLTRTTGAITPGLNDDYYSDNIQTRRVVSSDTSHYVLIKGIGRKQQQELARKHLEENMNKEQETDNEKAEDTQNREKETDNDDKTDIEMSSELQSKDLLEENKDNEKLYKGTKSKNKKKGDGGFESKEVISTDKHCEVITINDDIRETCEQKSAITDDVINLSDGEEPKPSTSSGSTSIQPSFIGGHDIDLDSDSDDDNGGISQQEILAMIKNENKKTSKNVAESENRFSISDDSSEDSDVEIQPEPKVTKVSPKMISKGTGNVDIKKKSEEKIENKDLHNMETLITERKRRLSLEQEICIEPKKLKQVDDNETVMTIDDSSKNDLVGQESTKGDNSEITINEDESEDEGFIEVSIDPNKAIPDDLFPEDIFTAPDKMATSVLPVTNEQDKVTTESVEKPPANDDESPKQSTSDSTKLTLPKESTSLDVEEEEDETSHLGHRDLAKDFKGLNEFDLQEWQDELEAESKTLKEEMNKQERLGASITDEMYIDAQGLLKIFGLPFITSPMEAEAQCAKLDELDLTQGTITDDSDVWLFGGKRVYKNFYQKDKHVEFYSNTSIQSQLGLNRSLLINIALLCGSDYTEGIQGVGPIKAMEIMTEFPGDGIHGLEYFRDWWEECQRQPKMPHEAKIRTQLRKLYVTPGFPSPTVVEAYLNPAVDDSKDPFSWSKPDLYQLREFATEKLGWSKAKIDEVLLPVMKRLNEQESKINMYFQPENFIKPANVKSKRLQKALDKFTASPTKQKGEGQNDNRSEVKVTKKTKTKRTMDPNDDRDETSEKHDSNTGEYEKLVKLTCEIEDFKMKNNLDNSNLAKLQRVRERLGIKVPKVKMPKGKGQRGRGKGRGVVGSSSTSEISVSNPKPATKIKDEIDLSESSGSSGDELLANLDLDAMIENADSGKNEPQSSGSGQKMSRSTSKTKSEKEPGGYIIDNESSDSEQDRKCSKRNSGKGKGRGKGSSNKRGQSSKRGHSLTSSLRTTSSRTSKSRAESKISRLQLSENDSDSD